METKVMILVVDDSGQIVAAANEEKPKDQEINVGISPLPGQRVYRVAVPKALTQLPSGRDFQLAISQLTLEPQEGKLVFRKFKKVHKDEVKSKKKQRVKR